MSPRDEKEVLADLAELCTTDGDIHALAFLVFHGSVLLLAETGPKPEDFERLTELLLHRGTKPKEVPTLAEFETRFVQEFAVANRQKPSTIASKKIILKKYLVPELGRKRLDEIKHEDVQRLKAKLVHLNPKTVNCILTVLTKLLKVAVEWQVMETLPVTVKLLRHSLPELPFYEPEDFERLVEGTKMVGPEATAAVLLGGHAACAEVRWSRWSGPTWTSSAVSSPSAAASGKARSSHQRAAVPA
jgi:hypothetical protein